MKQTKVIKETKLKNKLRKFTHNNTDKVQKCILSVFYLLLLMANPIDIIVTQDALKGVDAIIARVDLLDKKLADVAQNVIDSGKKIAAATNNLTPTAVNNKGTDSAKISAELDALKAKYVSLNDTVQKKIEQTRLAEIRLQQQREKAFDTFDKNAKKEQAQMQKTNGLYAVTEQHVKALTKTYNDLAIKKELGGTLSSKEEKQLQSLTTRINTYQNALKLTDAQIGKNTRNVGNYASGFNSFGNSVNQLTRELPAAAVSLNTFFLGISNNIAPISDEINKIRMQNKQLIAEGEKPVSVLGKLAGAVFSLQTLLSIGITLLTVYGGTVVKWIGSLNKADNSLSAVAKAQLSLNKAQADADKNTSDEITHLQLLASTAEDLALPMEARKRAVKEMQELYPHYLGNLSEEAILAGETSDQMKELAKNIMAAAVARGIEEEISKKAQSDFKERKKLIGELNNDLLGYQKALQSFNDVTNKEQKEAYLLNAKVQFQTTRERKLAALKALTEQQEAENEILIRGYKRQVELSGKLGPDGKDEADKKAAKVKKERREDIEGLESYLKTVGTLKDEIDAEINRLTTEQITGNATTIPIVNAQLEQLIKLRDQLNKKPTADVKILGDAPEVAKKQIDELTESMKNYLHSFSEEFASNSGFTETFKLINKEIEGFGKNWAVTTNAIMESAQEVFNFISETSSKNFEGEKSRLQEQYDVALKYAGDNKAAQEKLAEDLEKKKKDIDYREAKAKQKQALFNIAIDTAQAVISAVAESPLTFGLPWSAFALALGATQAALVASQDIPRYWMGGTHDGGLMMVNDGSGPNYKETVVTPDGKIMKPQGKNVVMNAPAGTEIYTHSMWQDKLAEMLQGKGIDMAPVINNNSGLSKDDMYDVLMDTLGSQPQHYSNFDAQGATAYILKGGNKTILNRNRSNGKGQRFR